MPVDKFGRRDTAVQDNVSSDVSFTQIGDYFIRRDGSNTAIWSINMTGNTLTNLSEPVHDHDAPNKLYVDRRPGGTDKVSRKGDTMQGDLDMGGYRITGLNTCLPPRHTDAVCWSRAVELTREVGQKASEQVMDVKRLSDLKVSKTGDLMTGNLLLSADGGNDRLFGCTDLPHDNTFTCVFGDTLNRFHFTLTHPVTLESSHGLLVKCRGEDICLMGNPSEIIIYKIIRMNSNSITNYRFQLYHTKLRISYTWIQILGKFYRDTFHLYDRWVAAITLS